MFSLSSMPRIRITRSALLLAVVLGVSGHLSAQDPPEGEDIRGPKPLVEIPREKKPPVALWSGIAGAVLVAAVAAMLWKRRIRRRRLQSPPEIALAALADLETSRETITAEAFANRAAHVVRQYIADRFGLAAPRRTTEEFLHDLTRADAPSLIGESDRLRVFLKSCDLAKFAGSHLDASRRGELLQAARGFIATTAPVPNSKAVTS